MRILVVDDEEEVCAILADVLVFITGDTLGDTVLEFLDLVGRPTLLKPFDFDDVLRVIRGALRSVAGPKPL